ncbi:MULTISPECIES: transcriptional antiterminator [unclassified Streptomyces]|uniref:transcriptional antiterminator n=1 Tax=unclassified Streptomyces TaxID=2593676 RepID=UPI00224D99BD|nr:MULTISPECIES: transcriptional antiterminator [unclassified Streptomyces]MCX4528366.1 transcriptional antiterminator [Streptomyces sp. NBC_01551]MCX4541035.1 transcriptional antiterminator [Streptomyces sp. NBC_01565]
MDDQLALRIRLFRDSGRVRPEVAAFVTAELGALAAEGRIVTEATAGMLTSHLLLALTRVLDGEPVDPRDADERVSAELAGHPEAVERARAISGRAAGSLGAPLPAAEVTFLGLHLAALAVRPAGPVA